MNTIIRHGRERTKRGILQSFDDLPVPAQETFKAIAKELHAIESSVTNVYVFGSYHWGVWDEQSDYDVRIHDDPTEALMGFKQEFEDKYGCKVDLMWARPSRHNMNLIKIPV